MLALLSTKVRPLFVHVINKVNERGIAPIYLRLTIHGKRAQLAIAVETAVGQFDNLSKRIKLIDAEGSKLVGEALKEAKQGNARLQEWESRVENTLLLLKAAGKQLTSPTMLKRVLLGAPVSGLTFLQLADQFNAWAERKGSPLAKSTLSGYQAGKVAFARFLERGEQDKNLLACEINQPLLRRYERWLEARGGKPSSTRKMIGYVQLAVNFGVAEGALEVNKAYGYRYQTHVPAPVPLALTIEQVALLESTVFNKYAQRIVDSFLFSVYTGLSPVDNQLFDATKHLIILPDEQGIERTWLHMVRQKMKNRKPEGFWVPIQAEARRILQRRTLPDGTVAMPKFDKRTANEWLAEVSKQLSFPFKVTPKHARSTFSQLMRDKGIPPATVAAMMGDSEAVMNKHYSKESYATVSLAMRPFLEAGLSPVPPTSAPSIKAERELEEGARILPFHFGASGFNSSVQKGGRPCMQ